MGLAFAERLVMMEGGDVVVTAGKAVCGSGEGLVYGCVDASAVYCAVYESRVMTV